jgi:hypothetical protein
MQVIENSYQLIEFKNMRWGVRVLEAYKRGTGESGPDHTAGEYVDLSCTNRSVSIRDHGFSGDCQGVEWAARAVYESLQGEPDHGEQRA